MPSVTEFKAIRYQPETLATRASAGDAHRPVFTESDCAPFTPIPELRHLSLHGRQHRPRSDQEAARPANGSSDYLTKTRQFAKTPVFAIGDLEQAHFMRRNPSSAGSSATSKAAQTHPFLPETLDADSLGSTGTIDSTTRQVPHPPGRSPALRRRKSFGALAMGSVSSHLQQDNNITLQICFELLTNELLAATTSLSEGLGTRTSELRLPLWLMIEAYEHLRDQLLEWASRNGREAGRLERVEMMFEIWVKSLQNIYENLGVILGDAHGLSEVVEMDEIVD